MRLVPQPLPLDRFAWRGGAALAQSVALADVAALIPRLTWIGVQPLRVNEHERAVVSLTRLPSNCVGKVFERPRLDSTVSDCAHAPRAAVAYDCCRPQRVVRYTAVDSCRHCGLVLASAAVKSSMAQ